LAAERFALALTRAGVPPAVIQVVHLSPILTEYVIKHPKVDFVAFTGSVTGGRFVQEVASHADGFKGVALEVSLCLTALDPILDKN
jgi:acyl-CoA reductase-like NAD-dependent aldehyde dehydrogenase